MLTHARRNRESTSRRIHCYRQKKAPCGISAANAVIPLNKNIWRKQAA
jgi:hypothetical protein